MNALSQNRNTAAGRLVIAVAPREVMSTFEFQDVTGQFPALSGLVEDVSNWDIPDAEVARGVTIRALPSTLPHIVVQYRTSTQSTRRFGETTLQHPPYRHVVTTLRSGVVTIGAPGPLGLVVARLKPEAAAGLLGDHLHAFADAKISLDSVFSPGAIDSLESKLAESRSSVERTAALAEFLLANMRPSEPDPVVSRAAANLRRNPVLRLGPLAAELGLSERHLIRRFKAVFGIGPKRFARAARVERVFAARGRGSSWAGIACACGFADQAHMIRDFKSILGVTPTDVFRAPLNGKAA